MAGQRFNPFTYLAVGEKHTALYTFDVLTGQVRRTSVPEWADGYDALGYRWKDGLLYAMSQANNDTLLVIDPVAGTVEPKRVSGMPRQSGTWQLGAMAPDGDRLVLTGSAWGPSVALNLATDPIAVTVENAPGAGGWYDWAYHPVDGRLYAVDGDTGAVMYADPARNPQKTVVKEGVFPKAEGGVVTRASYAALFFDAIGWLYAIDNAGNVHKADLRSSTAATPVTAEALGTAERVGRVPVAVRDLDVRDAAGDVAEQKVPPQYEELRARQTLRQQPWEEWGNPGDGPVLVYSFRVTIEAGTDPVRRWRVFFDRIPGAVVVTQAATLSLTEIEGRFVLDTPGEDHLVAAGGSLDVDLQVRVPKAGGAALTELPNLGARRIS